MNFEDFRKDIENKLELIADIELQEFHFEPSSFGNGLLSYRIKGYNHKFVFDGRENELTWYISKAHEKYFGATFSELGRFEGLHIDGKELLKKIKNASKTT